MPTILDVPVLPIARMRAVAVLSESLPGSEPLRLLVELANSDPELTAVVIRVANSAISAPINRIDTARAAIVRIGPFEARSRMLSAILQSTFDLTGAGLDALELWRHVVAVASVCEGGAGAAEPGAFTAGLLHDVGRMAMAAQQPERYARVIERAHLGDDAAGVEHEQFGLTHVEWGARLARAWKLPETIVLGVEQHHDSGAHGLGALVHRAREVASCLGIGDGLVEGTAPTLDDASLSRQQAWEQQLQRDEWAWRAVWRAGGVREFALRIGLDPDSALRAA